MHLTGTGVLVSLGGDVSVAGPAPDAGWPVRIADDHAAPLDEGGPVFAVAAGGFHDFVNSFFSSACKNGAEPRGVTERQQRLTADCSIFPGVDFQDRPLQAGKIPFHKREIRLSWRLIQLPPPIADYVIAHEVAHLVELNHSTRFWSLVESLLPGHEALKRELDDWTALLV